MNKLLLMFVLLSILSCNKKADVSREKYPNIILFLVDDMGLMDTEVPFVIDTNDQAVIYPLNDFYRTPNMKKLSDQGIRFSNFYAHSVCSPTRASILTGQNSARHATTNWILSEENNKTEFGPSDWNWKGLSKESITLPKILKEKGFTTIQVGKAHFGPFNSDAENPLNLGFDVSIAGNSYGHPGSYYGTDGFGHIAGQKKRAVPGLEKYHGQEIFLTEALTLEANNAISEATRKGSPFFLYLSHYAVHAPFQSDPRFADHYKGSNKSEKAQAYATLVEGIDKSLGDVIQHVKDLGIGENTLIIFLGDNGSDAPLPIDNGYSSSQPFRGKKGNHWDGGMRVPFIASWVTPSDSNLFQKHMPIRANSIQTQMGTIMDLLPTISALANTKPPKEHILDGYQLQQQLMGHTNTTREEVFLNHFPHGQHRTNYFSSFIKSDWKIIYHYQVDDRPKYELYNIKDDPFETENLTDQNPDQLKLMMELLIEEMKDKNALYPEKNGKKLSLVKPKKL